MTILHASKHQRYSIGNQFCWLLVIQLFMVIVDTVDILLPGRVFFFWILLWQPFFTMHSAIYQD